jgi:hypothetical protein
MLTKEATMTNNPIVLRPEMLSFDAVKIDGQHVLKICMHTANLGTFILPATPVQAEFIAASLFSYADQVAEIEAATADRA